MKKVLLIVLALITTGAFGAQKVTFVEDPTPPYIIGEIGKPPTGGIAIDVIKAVFEKIPEAEPEFVKLTPWKRSLKKVELGQLDAIMHIFKNPEREKIYAYSDYTYEGRTTFFYSKKVYPEGFIWNDFKDLEKARMCVLSGLSAEKTLKKRMKSDGLKFKITSVDSSELCIKMIGSGRQDVFVDNETVGKTLLAKLGKDDIIAVAEKPLYSRKLYMAFSRKSEAHKLLPKINEAIGALRADGTIQRILDGKN